MGLGSLNLKQTILKLELLSMLKDRRKTQVI